MNIMDIIDKTKKLTMDDFKYYDEYIKKNNLVITQNDLSKLLNLQNIQDFINSFSIVEEDNTFLSYLLSFKDIQNDDLYLATDDVVIPGIKSYLNSLPNKILDKQEIIALAYQFKNGDNSAGLKIVQNNLRYVVSIARKFVGCGLEFEDLIQEGNVGLLIALKNFDPSLDISFTTYARWWIRQSIIRAISLKSRMISLPVHLFEKIKKMEKLEKDFAVRFGHNPSESELADLLCISEEKVRKYNEFKNDASSYNIQIGDSDSESELIDFLEDDKIDFVDELVNQIDAKERISKYMYSSGLTAKEIEFLKYAFGFYGKVYSIPELAYMYNVSETRIVQVKKRILMRIKAVMMVRGEFPEIDTSKYYKSIKKFIDNNRYYNIYYCFSNVDEQYLTFFIDTLGVEDKEILLKIYGSDLLHPNFCTKEFNLNKNELLRIIGILNNAIKNSNKINVKNLTKRK